MNVKDEFKEEIQRLFSIDGVKGNDNWGSVRTPDQFTKETRQYEFGNRVCFEKKDQQAYADLQASRGLSLDPAKSVEENLQFVEKDGHVLPSNDITRFQELTELIDLEGLDNFVELGFRSPRLLKHYSSIGKTCFGYDIAKINVLAAKCPGYNADTHDLSSDDSIDLKTNSLVVAYHVFEHLPNPLKTLKKIHNALCKNSYFHIEIPIENVNEPVVRYAHCTSFFQDDLWKMLKDCGFKIVFNTNGNGIQRILAKK